jgi:DNA processing protein
MSTVHLPVVADDEAFAWLALGLVRELAPGHALELARRLGSATAVVRASAAGDGAGALAPALARAVRDGVVRARRERAALAAAGASVVTWNAAAYPSRLREIAAPPLALAVRGGLTAADDLAVAVVGARRASEYGRRMAAEIARGLAEAGVTVVSGLASGIDAAAHHAALLAGGRTVAVLGTGIDRVYPPWHRELSGAIAGRGALVSEFACGAPPRPFHFPRRNRVISGLALGTVVVEAAERSGSLVTARCALEQGREVFAVPGPAGVPGHRGSHRLIQQGARLVTCVEDVLEEVTPALAGALAERRVAAAEATLSPAERRVMEVIGAEDRHVDEVIRAAVVPAGPALETLLALELRGLLVQLPGKRFRRRAA